MNLILFQLYLFSVFSFGVLSAKAPSTLVGYDCHDQSSSITTVSLLPPDPCDPVIPKLHVESRLIQLLQLPRYEEIPIIQCKVEVFSTVTGCGKFADWSWAVRKGFHHVIQKPSRTECQTMIETKRFKLSDDDVLELPEMGVTYSKSIVNKGSISAGGACGKQDFTQNGQSYENSVSQQFFEVLISVGHATLDRDTNKILFPSGLSSGFHHGEALDIFGSYIYWDNKLPSVCPESQDGVEVLYEGYANISTSNSSEQFPMVTVSSGESSFSLALRKDEILCGALVHATDHHQLKLYVVENNRVALLPFKRSSKLKRNLDFAMYVNNKFVYIERHLGSEINRLYEDLSYHKCNVERTAIKNLLTTALVSADEFAFTYTESPGYTTLVRGEVAHIIKCTPKPVVVSFSSDKCFKELKIVHSENRTGFLSSRNRIILSHGTEIPCHPLLPTMFHLGNLWVSPYPYPNPVQAPSKISPSKPFLRYNSISGLADTGIYSEKQVEEYQQSLLFSREETAITSNLAMGLSGHQVDFSRTRPEILFNEVSIEDMVTRYFNRIWGLWSSWGTFAAGWIGLILVIKLIFMILDKCVNLVALYSVFGMSKFLLAFLWDSLSHNLVLMKHMNKKIPGVKDVIRSFRGKRKTVEDVEMGPSAPLKPIDETPSGDNLIYPNILNQREL